MIPSVTKAVLILDSVADDSTAPTASWPEGNRDTAALTDAGKIAIAKRAAIVLPQGATWSASSEGPAVVACPLFSNERVVGVVVVELETLDEQQQQALIQLLKWGSAWLEFFAHGEGGTAIAGRLATVVEVTAGSLEHQRLQAAATAAITHLAQAISCDRVSLGFLDGKNMRVRALSHTARLDRRSKLVRDIEAAMDEALDEGALIIYPPPQSGPLRGTKAHERLARGQDGEAVCTVLLSSLGKAVGALTFERVHGPRFDKSTVDVGDAVAALLGPVLEMKRLEDRSIAAKAGDYLAGSLRRLLGRRYLWTKVALACFLGLVCFLGLATGEYRVGATAVLEGTVHRALVAPIDGYIKVAHAHAGNVVKQGDVLAALDDRELELERRKWAGERDDFIKKHRRAIGNLDRAEARILEAQVGKAQAQLALIEEHLARTRIVAPFDGVIVSGDLRQSLGAPVERGQVIFELAPLDSYRVVLHVDEGDVANVAAGQRGHLALAAMPSERLPFVVEDVIGIAQADDGRNVFRVEARLEKTSNHLRPGMKGIGKIEVEQRKLLWIWTHALVDRVSLWFWSRLP